VENDTWRNELDAKLKSVLCVHTRRATYGDEDNKSHRCVLGLKIEGLVDNAS
jgi:hypothetical protein